ncbi:putative lipase [Triangularia verruculosa]|uniref:sn-1-specific diacylglycerol lipase n=1 Tax=Triangularia verruculosa TaxID=2587418 RepID=A0AAN6XIE0_9PEZI|nr:putative lipase [Triangularia verruculosa]
MMIIGNHGSTAEDVDMDLNPEDSGPARLAVIPDEDMGTQIRDLSASNPGKTLLPTPVAKVVSFATRSTGLALRMSTVIGGYGFDAAKLTTLSSLELGRSILGGIISRAGKDVISRSGTHLERSDAETTLERSLENLHRTMTQIVFWTTTSFHVTGTTLAMISETSQLLLSTLDQFFGSTDSSRAMASIITLIRREFQNPATGRQGEKVGVIDLMLGLCGMAYLQRWCRRLLEEESRTLRIEEVVWDVVVLSDGVRVDVHDESLYGVHDGSYATEEATSNETVIAINNNGEHNDDDRNGLPVIQLEQQIMRSLPDNARVSITRQIRTTEIITVEVTGGDEDIRVDTPPGVELIEEPRAVHPSVSQTQLRGHSESSIPDSRFVFRHSRSHERRTWFQKEGGDVSQVAGSVEQIDTESPRTSDAETEVEEDIPPSVPQKPSRERLQTPIRRPSFHASGSPTSPSSISKPTRIPSASRHGVENAANQKRPRIPPTNSSANDNRPSFSSRRQSFNRLLPSYKQKEDSSPGVGSLAKKGGFRNAFTKSGRLFNREDSGSESSNGKGKKTSKRTLPRQVSSARPPSHLAAPNRQPSVVLKQPMIVPPQKLGATKTSRPGTADSRRSIPRSESRASYISVHSRRDSSISQTETFSITTAEDYRPVSPYMENSSTNPVVRKARSDRELGGPFGSPGTNHRRVRSHMYAPSIYTLRANESQSSLVPYQSYQPRSAYSDTEALGTLRKAGKLATIFPNDHFLNNITRYMRFASASYGSNFLRVLGIAKEMPILRALDDTHHELRCFAHHTESDANSILLSSFVDPQGGSDGTGSTNTGVPLVHYISLDHKAKAVVLACRGTLGFEDVLADMTCDYDDLVWRGKAYKVHKGVHASAKRLLYGGDGRVLYTLKQALEEFSEYGLVLTGHSLGGAVTALLGVMLSEPHPSSATFITSANPHTRLLGDGTTTTSFPHHEICLPAGRPVHVFAYGPPSTMSASLSKATRGLITSIVNGNDLVPYLSLGVLHDFQAVSLAFKTDNNEAKVEVRQRIWDALQSGIADKWYGSSGSSKYCKRDDDDEWAYAALKVLRASMMSQKLLPPGEVFVVESTRVLRRDAFLVPEMGGEDLGRPAHRVVLKYVRDVEKRFREVRFGTSMLTDHSPGKYEDALNKLRAGVMDH